MALKVFESFRDCDEVEQVIERLAFVICCARGRGGRGE
jgi:hypothetical protein